MKPGRMPCVVPHCGRTCKIGRWAEWMCGQHWKLTSRVSRRCFFKARREGRRMRENTLWEHLKKQAIERAGGID